MPIEIILPIVLGVCLLLACISGAIGFLCTQSARGLFPGLLFGLPAVVLSLAVFILGIESIEEDLFPLFIISLISIPPLYLGSLVLCRGFQTGNKLRDFTSGMFVCVSIFLCGFLLSKHPDLLDWFILYLPMHL
ncbi:MAG TPA: hypothetical protein VGI03_02820 [Verrucomicrobiae bacterium]